MDVKALKYLPAHQRMVFLKLEELGNPPKPTPKDGEMACIECYGHGILRETSRRRTFGGGWDVEQKCEFCGWSEPIHEMAPWEKELFDQEMPRIMAEIRLSERGKEYRDSPDGQFDQAFLRMSRRGKGEKYPEMEADLKLLEARLAERDSHGR